jgi:tetratricopeptide (TPR) repeat protein
MQTSEFLIEFQRILNPDDASRVLFALRHDPLVWAGVQADDIFQKVSTFAGGLPELWSPANITLMILGAQDTAESLAVDPMVAVEKPLRQRALQVYEENIKKTSLPGSLEEAGFIALALRERRRLTRTWEGFIDELTKTEPGAQKGKISNWATSLACLYPMVPDPTVMLQVVLKGEDLAGQHALVDHVLFSNPLTIAERVHQYSSLLENLSATEQTQWLQSLVVQGQKELAAELSRRILKANEQTQPLPIPSANEEDPSTVLAKALRMEFLSGLYRHAGENDMALNQLHSAKAVINQWMEDINLQIAWLASQNEENGKAEEIAEEALESMVEIGGLHSEFALSLGHQPVMKKVLDRVANSPSEKEYNPFLLIEQARWMNSSGDKEGAKETAREAVSKLVSSPNRAKWIHPRHALDWKPARYIRTLSELDLLSEALELNMLMLQYQPAEDELIHSAAEILEDLGDIDQALNYARMGVVLSPTDALWRRTLASLLEEKEQWEVGFQERDQVVQLSDSVSIEDWCAYIQTAIKCGYLQKAIDTCKELLTKFPNEGVLNRLLGKALLASGETREASIYLGRSILLAPEDIDAWLMLAESYQKSDEPQRALESLRAAVLAVPDSPELNFRLAQECLKANIPSEALPFLRRAAVLIPESYEAAFQLSQALHTLGHLPEAASVLANARQKWPQDPDMAFEHAQVLQGLGDIEASIPLLEIALRKSPPQFDRYLLYAKTLLGDWHQYFSFNYSPDFPRLVNAQQAIGKALNLEPENYLAHVMMAEILAAKGDFETAYDIYHGLVEAPEARMPEWRLRVQGGFGRVALETKHIETALAALQDATNFKPDEVFFQHLLAEAYLTANLGHEALQAARYAHKLAPDDLETLSWFATFALHLGAEKEAINSLQCATQLAPAVPDYWLRLANIQLQVGNREEARAALERLFQINQLDTDHYRQAAYAYLRMQENEAALRCLQMAVKASASPSSNLLFELAQLQAKSDQLESALEVLQEAIDATPDNINLHVFQSDLMDALGRPQAALACLEHALRLSVDHEGQADAVDLSDGRWWESMSNLAAIEARFGKLMYSDGNLSAAIQHFERALDLWPKDLTFRLIIATLYQDLMDMDGLRGMARYPETVPVDHLVASAGSMTMDEYEAFIQLTSLMAEIKLQSHDAVAAAQLVDPILVIGRNHPRILAVQSRLASSSGSLQTANELLAAAKRGYLDQKPAQTVESKKTSFSLLGEFLRTHVNWLADAASESQQWDLAISYGRKSVEMNPNSPGAFFELAKKRVLCAERSLLCKALNAVAYTPGDSALSDSAYQEFLDSVSRAGQLSRSESIQRWKVRGEAVFHPTAQNIRELASIIRKPGDTAALVLALREAGNIAAAIQMAGDAPNAPEVMVQLALCYQESNVQRGLEIAQIALMDAPNDPLRYAVVALLAGEAGKDQVAQEALEDALSIWPDEAHWHAWAARLAEKVESQKVAIQHLEVAVRLQPASTEYALALGRLYMQQGDPFKVVEVLNNSDHLQSGNSEIWFTLAMAYRQLGHLTEAIACAEKAAELDRSDAQPLLLCGEVTLESGDDDIAYFYGKQALDRDPKNADVVLFLASLLLEQKKKDDALALIEAALPTRQPSIPLLFVRARLVYDQRGARPALSLLRETVRNDPDNGMAYAVLAKAEAECHELEQARTDLHRALRLQPDQPDLTLLMGRLQHEDGQLDQAIHFYSETIRLAPGMLDAYMELAQTYQERRESQQALKTYQQAIRSIPNDYRPYYASAIILREGKDYLGAEDMLRKAAKLAPDDLNIRRQLGAIIALNLVHHSQEVNTFR